jgi:PEP-CTERM motif
MFLKSGWFCALAVAGLLIGCGSAHAALTVYTSAAEFAAATMKPGVDTFADLSVGGLTTSPISRVAGSYGYSASSPGDFFATAANGYPYLSPNLADDPMVFYDFTSGVRGVAGNFFGSDIDGVYLPGSITVVATDLLGATASYTVDAESSSVGGFLGFVSDTSFTSVWVTASQANYALWPTLSSLTLAAAGDGDPVPIPEPASSLLMILGLSLVGLASRHRGRRWR